MKAFHPKLEITTVKTGCKANTDKQYTKEATEGNSSRFSSVLPLQLSGFKTHKRNFLLFKQQSSTLTGYYTG